MKKALDYFRGRSALVTGASSGIGEELSWQLARAGASVTLASRRREVLEQLADRMTLAGLVRPLVAECDVASEGGPERAVADSIKRWGKLDVVVANAGFGVSGRFERLSLEDYKRQFETNVFGVLRTLYAALPHIEQTRGHLVVVSSVAGWVATPGTSPYSMSKFALRAFANAVTPELAAAGVKLTLISPGFVASNIRRIDNRGVLHSDAPDPVPSWLQMRTDHAARRILEAAARGRREAIITGHGKLLVALERLAPWVNRAIGKRTIA